MTTLSEELINAFVTPGKAGLTVKRDPLSMSASNELEPGPRNCGTHCGAELASGLSAPMKPCQAQATARTVGRGGFTGG
ncbi:MAG: hypothetical protein DMG35_01065 [Acidobacteria bacterium]|nr:MAG: hypothetical protein DMG35_01065 [Acidobacteriota bacterium]